jgi:hypothetical protein
VVEQAKYYVVIDDIEEWFDADGNFEFVKTYFNVYQGDKKIIDYGRIDFIYDDESTKEYIRDIRRVFMEHKVSLKGINEDFMVLVNDDYGNIVMTKIDEELLNDIKENI